MSEYGSLELDTYGFRKMRNVSSIIDLAGNTGADGSQVVETGQVQGAVESDLYGGFRGIQHAANPHNPLLWIVILALLLSGFVALSFHVKLGSRRASVSV